MIKLTTQQRVDAAFDWVARRLQAIGFVPDTESGTFIRGDDDDRVMVKVGINMHGDLCSLIVEGTPDRIVAMLTPPGGKADG